MRRHQQSKHKDVMERDWFKCSTCGRLFSTENELRAHNRKICRQLARSRGVINTSKLIFHCDMCPRRFRDHSTLSKHCNKVHQESISKIWKLCPECNSFFPPESIKGHTRLVHSKEDVLCQFCAELVRGSYYFQHVNRFHFNDVGDTWLKCPTCEWVLPNEEELSIHRPRERCRALKCQVCKAKFQARFILRAHIRRRHPEEALHLLQECSKCLTEVLSADTKHSCNAKWNHSKAPKRCCKFCRKEMTSRKSYFEHANNDHQEIIKENWMSCPVCLKYYPDLKFHGCKKPSQKITNFKCDFCDSVSKDSFCLHLHVNRKHKFWLKKSSWVKCPACPKYFVNQFYLKCHSKTKHGFDEANHDAQDQKLTCSHCQEQLPDAQALVVHQERHSVDVLASNRKGICEFCSIQVKLKNYVNHANQCHPREVREVWHGCKVCNFHLETKTSLIRHIINRHTNKRAKVTCNESWRCDFCRKELSDDRNLGHHVHKYHKRQMEKHWHCCQQCKMFFPSKQSLLVHQRKMHLDFCGSMVTTCNLCKSEFPTFESFCIHANKNHLEQLKEKTDWLFCKKCLLYWPVQKMTEHQTDCLNNCRMKSTCVHCEEKIDSSGHHFNTKHRDKVAAAWYNCSDCQWYFFTEEQLWNHCKFAHMLEEDQSSDSSAGKYVSCSFCPEMFLRKSGLNFYYHCNTVHEDKVKSEWLECQDCDTRRPDLRELTYHQVKVHLNSRTT